jgi:hypothetical protein
LATLNGAHNQQVPEFGFALPMSNQVFLLRMGTITCQSELCVVVGVAAVGRATRTFLPPIAAGALVWRAWQKIASVALL